MAESEERLQWIVCYRAREETGRLDMEKMGEGSEDVDPAYVLCPASPAYFLLWQSGLQIPRRTATVGVGIAG